MKPLVSVIIPVYNVFPYIREAIDSIINQTYKSLEIIIIDDGSSDGSERICDEYCVDHRVKVIHQKNRGLSGARNTGLDTMTGEYVAFLDSDDAFFPNMIQQMIDGIESSKADIITCGYNSYETELHEFKKRRVYDFAKGQYLSSHDALNWMIMGKLSCAVWNKLFHAHLWDGIRFPEGHVYEDVWVTPKLLESTQCIFTLPQILVKYRMRNGSITNTRTISNIKDHYFSIRQLIVYAIEHNPELFRGNNTQKNLENRIREMSFILMEWANLEGKTRQIVEQREQLLDTWQSMSDIVATKSKVTYLLLKYAPHMMLWIRRLYKIGKRIVSRKLVCVSCE